MENLISKLKDDHLEIITLFEEIENDIKKNSIPLNEIRKKLLDEKDLLLKHLNFENERLYPILRIAAMRDEKLEIILDIFKTEMENLSIFINKFFEDFEKMNEYGFAIQFGKLYSMILHRLKMEENVLYKEFDKYREYILKVSGSFSLTLNGG